MAISESYIRNMKYIDIKAEDLVIINREKLNKLLAVVEQAKIICNIWNFRDPHLDLHSDVRELGKTIDELEKP
jgi:hypothetical protein